jgi:hypothetical protein
MNNHVEPIAREALRDGAPDAAARSGDQHL